MFRVLLGMLLFTLVLGTAACKQGGSLSMESNAPGPTTATLNFVGGADFVSMGAAQTSTGGATMQSSLGDFISDVQQTNSSNYTLFSNVEGQMISTQ